MGFARSNLPRWTPEQYRSRPRDFDPGLAESICDRVANGESLSEICESRDMPLPATFLRWTRSDPSTEALWRQAQLDRLDVLGEECLLIADEAKDSRMASNAIAVRHWAAERLNPKKFAQRTVSTGLGSSESDDEAGVDYGRDVRRKLEAMAERRAQAALPEAAA